MSTGPGEARKGERLGWTLGWLGGFAWVAVLAGVFAVQGRGLPAVAGLLLFAMAGLAIRRNAPWRHPDQPYWRLMAPLYGLMALSVVWVFWGFEDASAEPVSGWQLLWWVPLLLPLIQLGRRTWRMGEGNARSPEQGVKHGEHD